MLPTVIHLKIAILYQKELPSNVLERVTVYAFVIKVEYYTVFNVFNSWHLVNIIHIRWKWKNIEQLILTCKYKLSLNTCSSLVNTLCSEHCHLISVEKTNSAPFVTHSFAAVTSTLLGILYLHTDCSHLV